MLRFFRHIRQNLLLRRQDYGGQVNENKTVKYFKYAIGEFLLIVAGILVALQIQNWNEGRLDRLKEVEYLQNLLVEMQAAQEEFVGDRERQEDILTGGFNFEVQESESKGELGACERPCRSKRLSCDETKIQPPNSSRTLYN